MRADKIISFSYSLILIDIIFTDAVHYLLAARAVLVKVFEAEQPVAVHIGIYFTAVYSVSVSIQINNDTVRTQAILIVKIDPNLLAFNSNLFLNTSGNMGVYNTVTVKGGFVSFYLFLNKLVLNCLA